MTTIANPLGARPAPVYEPSRRLLLVMWLVLVLAMGLTLFLSRRTGHLEFERTKAAAQPGSAIQTQQPPVLLSGYGEVLDRKLTYWSGWYCFAVAVLLLVSVYGWQISLAPPLSLLLPVVTSLGAVAAGWSVYVMAVLLHATCGGCLVLDGLYVLLFGLSLVYAWQDWRHRQSSRITTGVPPLPAMLLVVHAAGAVLLGIAVLAVLANLHAPLFVPEKIVERKLSVLAVQPLNKDELNRLPVDAGSSPVWSISGSRDAPHKLVVYACLTSPASAKLQAVLNAIAARHPGKLRIDMRFFPLSPNCNEALNPLAVEEKNETACPLTRVALAVAMVKPEAFPGFIDWLYENQAKLALEQAKQEAMRRVDPEAFRKQLDSDALWQRFREDPKLAGQLKVRSVPQILLPDGRVYGGVNVRNLEALLAERFSWPVEKPSRDQPPLWVNDDLVTQHGNLGLRLAKRGKYEEAVRELKQAMALRPDWSELGAKLAWILATCPDDKVRHGTEALVYARRAIEPPAEDTAELHDVLAAALAENGRFADAMEESRKALALCKKSGQSELEKEVTARQQDYMRAQPYRAPKSPLTP